MKILAVSDQAVEAVYSGCVAGRFDDVALVVSCGDLSYSYLEYIVTMLNVPCLYVHGNHDQPEHRACGGVRKEPGGWVNLDGKTVEREGLLFAGLEGSIRYKPGATFQYTERQMAWKAWRLTPALLMNRIHYGRYLDVLVTHSPPCGIHDGDDPAHRGFETFLALIERFKPRYLFHGHKHVYGPQQTCTRYGETDVVNVHPYRVLRY